MWWISFCSKLLFIFHRGTHGTHKNGLRTVPSRSQSFLSRPVPRIFWNCPVLSRPALLLNFRVPSQDGTGREKSRVPPISDLDYTGWSSSRSKLPIRRFYIHRLPRRKKVTETFFYWDWISGIESSWEGVSTVKISHWLTLPSWRCPGPTYQLKTGVSEILGICPAQKKRKDTPPWSFFHWKERKILSGSKVFPGHRSRSEIHFWSTDSLWTIRKVDVDVNITHLENKRVSIPRAI